MYLKKVTDSYCEPPALLDYNITKLLFQNAIYSIHSRLIPKNIELREETVVTVLKAESEIESVMKTVIQWQYRIYKWKLSDGYITKIKEALKKIDNKNSDASSISSCGNIMHSQRVMS